LETLVRFLILSNDTKQKLICELSEKFYLAGKKVVILVKDSAQGNEFDHLLWIWKQASFIPHLYNQQLSNKILEPVVLTMHIENNPGFEVLLLAHPVPLDTVLKFEQVIDFAEKYDSTLLNSSRDRFKLYRDNKIKVETWQPGDFLVTDIK
jgi:DNA polymerase-3 subunit chi